MSNQDGEFESDNMLDYLWSNSKETYNNVTVDRVFKKYDGTRWQIPPKKNIQIPPGCLSESVSGEFVGFYNEYNETTPTYYVHYAKRVYGDPDLEHIPMYVVHYNRSRTDRTNLKQMLVQITLTDDPYYDERHSTVVNRRPYSVRKRTRISEGSLIYSVRVMSYDKNERKLYYHPTHRGNRNQNILPVFGQNVEKFVTDNGWKLYNHHDSMFTYHSRGASDFYLYGRVYGRNDENTSHFRFLFDPTIEAKLLPLDRNYPKSSGRTSQPDSSVSTSPSPPPSAPSNTSPSNGTYGGTPSEKYLFRYNRDAGYQDCTVDEKLQHDAVNGLPPYVTALFLHKNRPSLSNSGGYHVVNRDRYTLSTNDRFVDYSKTIEVVGIRRIKALNNEHRLGHIPVYLLECKGGISFYAQIVLEKNNSPIMNHSLSSQIGSNNQRRRFYGIRILSYSKTAMKQILWHPSHEKHGGFSPNEIVPLAGNAMSGLHYENDWVGTKQINVNNNRGKVVIYGVVYGRPEDGHLGFIVPDNILDMMKEADARINRVKQLQYRDGNHQIDKNDREIHHFRLNSDLSFEHASFRRGDSGPKGLLDVKTLYSDDDIDLNTPFKYMYVRRVRRMTPNRQNGYSSNQRMYYVVEYSVGTNRGVISETRHKTIMSYCLDDLRKSSKLSPVTGASYFTNHNPIDGHGVDLTTGFSAGIMPVFRRHRDDSNPISYKNCDVCIWDSSDYHPADSVIAGYFTDSFYISGGVYRENDNWIDVVPIDGYYTSIRLGTDYQSVICQAFRAKTDHMTNPNDIDKIDYVGRYIYFPDSQVISGDGKSAAFGHKYHHGIIYKNRSIGNDGELLYINRPVLPVDDSRRYIQDSGAKSANYGPGYYEHLTSKYVGTVRLKDRHGNITKYYQYAHRKDQISHRGWSGFLTTDLKYLTYPDLDYPADNLVFESADLFVYPGKYPWHLQTFYRNENGTFTEVRNVHLGADEDNKLGDKIDAYPIYRTRLRTPGGIITRLLSWKKETGVNGIVKYVFYPIYSCMDRDDRTKMRMCDEEFISTMPSDLFVPAARRGNTNNSSISRIAIGHGASISGMNYLELIEPWFGQTIYKFARLDSNIQPDLSEQRLIDSNNVTLGHNHVLAWGLPEHRNESIRAFMLTFENNPIQVISNRATQVELNHIPNSVTSNFFTYPAYVNQTKMRRIYIDGRERWCYPCSFHNHNQSADTIVAQNNAIAKRRLDHRNHSYLGFPLWLYDGEYRDVSSSDISLRPNTLRYVTTVGNNRNKQDDAVAINRLFEPFGTGFVPALITFNTISALGVTSRRHAFVAIPGYPNAFSPTLSVKRYPHPIHIQPALFDSSRNVTASAVDRSLNQMSGSVITMTSNRYLTLLNDDELRLITDRLGFAFSQTIDIVDDRASALDLSRMECTSSEVLNRDTLNDYSQYIRSFGIIDIGPLAKVKNPNTPPTDISKLYFRTANYGSSPSSYALHGVTEPGKTLHLFRKENNVGSDLIKVMDRNIGTYWLYPNLKKFDLDTVYLDASIVMNMPEGYVLTPYQLQKLKETWNGIHTKIGDLSSSGYDKSGLLTLHSIQNIERDGMHMLVPWNPSHDYGRETSLTHYEVSDFSDNAMQFSFIPYVTKTLTELSQDGLTGMDMRNAYHKPLSNETPGHQYGAALRREYNPIREVTRRIRYNNAWSYLENDKFNQMMVSYLIDLTERTRWRSFSNGEGIQFNEHGISSFKRILSQKRNGERPELFKDNIFFEHSGLREPSTMFIANETASNTRRNTKYAIPVLSSVNGKSIVEQSYAISRHSSKNTSVLTYNGQGRNGSVYRFINQTEMEKINRFNHKCRYTTSNGNPRYDADVSANPEIYIPSICMGELEGNFHRIDVKPGNYHNAQPPVTNGIASLIHIESSGYYEFWFGPGDYNISNMGIVDGKFEAVTFAPGCVNNKVMIYLHPDAKIKIDGKHPQSAKCGSNRFGQFTPKHDNGVVYQTNIAYIIPFVPVSVSRLIYIRDPENSHNTLTNSDFNRNGRNHSERSGYTSTMRDETYL